MTAGSIIALEHASKHYGSGAQTVAALTDVTLAVPAGQFLSVVGPSGSAKSTLLDPGGEQRALVTEPRGTLDSRTGRLILDLLRDLNAEQYLSVVLVTHSAFAATDGQRTVELRDGRIVRDVRARREPTVRLRGS